MLIGIQFESVFAGAIEATVAVDAMMLTATVGPNAFVGICNREGREIMVIMESEQVWLAGCCECKQTYLLN